MTLHIFDDIDQRSPEWYAARAGIVTASIVGKLLTPTLKVADNDTSRGITASLVAERISGHVEETAMTSDMWRGVEMEPYAPDIYSGHYQQAVECGFMRYDGDGWTLGYSPDGLIADEGLLEVKCPRAKGHIRTILADRVPSAYIPQLQAAYSCRAASGAITSRSTPGCRCSSSAYSPTPPGMRPSKPPADSSSWPPT